MDRESLEDISKQLIAIQSDCDKARTDINKILKRVADLQLSVQLEINALESVNISNQEVSIEISPSKEIKKIVVDIIRDISKDIQGPAPRNEVLDRAEKAGISREKTEIVIDRLRRDGSLFEPRSGMLRLP